jgi:phage terminase large subunit-like protein
VLPLPKIILDRWHSAGGRNIFPLIYHTSTSATWTATLKGPAGKFVAFDWGDGSAPTVLELAPGGTPFIHDFSGGSGTGVIRIYGDIADITYNSVPSNSISGILSWVGLDNLSIIYLNNNSISDISTLNGLTNLNYLYLHSNSIVGISPLSGLTNLVTLYLHGNSIVDISPLSGLTNLVTLYLYSNSISDISALSGLTNLTTFYLHYNSISDISPLVGLANLTTLNLHENNVAYPLTGLTWFTATSGIFYFSSTVDSSAEVDRYIKDHNAALWEGATIYYDGTNPPRTAGSDVDLLAMLVRGCTIYVNE